MNEPVSVGTVIDRVKYESVECRKWCRRCEKTWRGASFVGWAKNPLNLTKIDGKAHVIGICTPCVNTWELKFKQDEVSAKIANLRRTFLDTKKLAVQLGLARQLEKEYSKARDLATTDGERARLEDKRGNARGIALKLEGEVKYEVI